MGKVRQLNEDAFFSTPEIGLWLVADGMGGHSAGDVASRIIIESFQGLPSPQSMGELLFAVRTRLDNANRCIREEAQRRPGNPTIGSTIVVFLAHDHACRCLWAGDSRAYMMRDGGLAQLTRDHTLVERMIAKGNLDVGDAAAHPQANVITRAVGTHHTLDLEEFGHDTRVGDKVLLCSDGLNKELDDDEIAQVLRKHDHVEAADLLIDKTLKRGARDNVTVVVIEFGDKDDAT